MVFPSSRCPAFMGITSHSTLPWYFPMLKVIVTLFVIFTSVSSLSHFSLYGLECLIVSKPILSTMYCQATLVRDRPSIIRLHTLPFTAHLVLKMFSLWEVSYVCTCKLKTLLVIKSSPDSGYWMCSSGSISSSSFWDSYSPLAVMIITLLVGQSLEMCPLPWHLQHIMSLVLCDLEPLPNSGLELLAVSTIFPLNREPISTGFGFFIGLVAGGFQVNVIFGLVETGLRLICCSI